MRRDADVACFVRGAIAGYRARLTLLGDSGHRRTLEDAIALLSDERVASMDAARFEALLGTLSAGRHPLRAALLKPDVIGRELTARWREWTAIVDRTRAERDAASPEHHAAESHVLVAVP